MIALVARRLLQSLFVMAMVSLLAFTLFRFVGDPVAQMVGQETSLEDQARLRASLGLDDPVITQYANFVGNLLSGEFGYSYRTRQPIGEMILARMPATFELGLASLVISLLLGIPAGIYTAIRRGGVVANLILVVTLIGVSVPTFVIGIFLIYVFGVELGWLPTFGRGDTVQIGWWKTSFLTLDGWRSLLLPALTLGVYQLTLTMRLVRSEMQNVLKTDYIRFARARGIDARALYLGHALKNTLVPVITIVGLQFGGVIAFSIVTEAVFQWPGLGLLFLDSIRYVDIPVMSVYLVLIAMLFVIINLIVDVLYAVIDPRVRLGGRMSTLLERLRRFGTENEFLYLFLHSRLAMIAATVAVLGMGAAALAPLIAPFDPYDIGSVDILDSLVPPGWTDGGDARFLLGTDDQGRDLWSAILYGTRLSLVVGLSAIVFASVLGVTLGLLAGYLGGRLDAVIMRIADVQLALPAILTALLVDGIARGLLPRDTHDELMLVVLTVAIGLSLWVNFARTARASTFVERQKEYVQAAEVMGVHPVRILLVHILPNILGPLLVILTIDLAVAVLLEATLSFLGVGVPPNQPSLGTLIRTGTEYLFSGEWWIVLFPSLTLVVLIVAVNVLGDFLRDVFDPRLR